ncbi:MAG: hypothetical protein V4850_27835 [Myxococcota bacterium]
MHVLSSIFALVSCAPPLPDDVTPWEPAPLSCPTELPDAPAPDSAEWASSSPPLGGDVIIFGTSAADPDLVYAGSGQNGIFRSHDQGFTWDAVNVSVGHLYGQFAISQADANCLAFTSGQPYVSDDQGEHLRPMSLAPEDASIQGLVYVGRNLLMLGGNGEVWSAPDCGTTPIRIGTIQFGAPPPSSAHAHGQISSTWWMAARGEAVYAMSQIGVIFGSVDEGVTWITHHQDPAWVNVTFRVDDNYQWVVRQGTSTFEVQRRNPRSDLSVGFETVATLDGAATGAYLTAEGEYLVSSTLGIWSSEGGELEVGIEDEGLGIYSVARVGNSLLAGYRAGVSVSPDDGASWGWTSEEFYDLDIVNLHVHPVCPNVLFAGTQCRTGTFRSDDYGQTWSRITAAMHYTMGVDISPAAPEQVWAVTDDEVYVSKDMGLTWENRYPKGVGVAGAHYHGLGISPDRPSTVLIGSVGSGEYADDTARIYRTDNNGATWSKSSTGLPESTESFHAIHFADTVPGAVLLGTYRSGAGISHGGTTPGIGVFRSTDLGNTWAQLDSTPALSFSHFAECDGRIYAATNEGILATEDVGDTWEVLLAPAEGSEMLNVACAGARLLAVDPQSGVFRSPDGGATWEDWTGSITFDLQAWEVQLGLELSTDGEIAYFTHPGVGVLLRGWE